MILVFCWEWNISWMLQLSALFLSLIRMLLFSRSWSKSLFCDSSEFSFVIFIETIFLLSVTEVVIQLKLKLLFMFDSALTAKHASWLLYAWIICSLVFYKLLHDLTHTEWALLQFRQWLRLLSVLIKHWSSSWFVSAQKLHLWMNLHTLIMWS